MAPLPDPKHALYPPWCLIESDPETFQRMTHMYGVRGIQVEEVVTLDDLVTFDRPVYGLIMSSALDLDTLSVKNDKMDPDAESLFFSCQVVTNVCATSALLGVLLNIEDNDLVIGDELRHFKDFTKDFTPVDRGMTVANSEMLQKTHNTFASFESKMDAKEYPRYNDIKPGNHAEEDTPSYHFVAFIPSKGYVWELDGYNKVPIKLHKITHNWLEHIVAELKSRMDESGDVNFNMLAITKANGPPSTTSAKAPLSSSLSLSQTPPAIPSAPSPEQQVIMAQHQVFYGQLIHQIEGYLDVICHDWRQHTLEQHTKIDSFHQTLPPQWPPSTFTNQDQISQTIGGLINTTATRATVISLLKQKRQAHAHLDALLGNNMAPRSNGKKAYNPSTATFAQTNSAYDDEDKVLLRRQHDYVPFINALFAKMDEEDVL